MTSGYEALLVLSSFIGLCVWAFLSDKITTKKEMGKLIQEQKEWLAEENSKPKYRVRVETKGGSIYSTSPFEPSCELEVFMEYCLNKDPSKDKAQRKIENFIANGRYVHEDMDTYIPLCEIKYFEVVKV